VPVRRAVTVNPFALLRWSIDQEARLDVLGQRHGERRTQDGVLRIAVLVRASFICACSMTV
jgi:hypothetical protein